MPANAEPLCDLPPQGDPSWPNADETVVWIGTQTGAHLVLTANHCKGWALVDSASDWHAGSFLSQQDQS